MMEVVPGRQRGLGRRAGRPYESSLACSHGKEVVVRITLALPVGESTGETYVRSTHRP
jgi:hypothetical protein